MPEYKLKVGALVGLLMLTACSKKGDNWDYAISPGAYSLSGPVCLSTNKSPAYRTVAQRINLFDFDAVIKQALTIDGAQSTRTISSNDCTLRIGQPVAYNKNNAFILQLSRRVTFEPENCSLHVSAGNESFAASAKSSESLQDRDGNEMDIPYEVVPTENGEELISADNEELNALWGTYGCSTPDRIKWVLITE